MTDLAREIEELLPCWAYSGCTGQAHERACLARVRPTALTLIRTLLREERERCAVTALEQKGEAGASWTLAADACARAIRALEDRQ